MQFSTAYVSKIFQIRAENVIRASLFCKPVWSNIFILVWVWFRRNSKDLSFCFSIFFHDNFNGRRIFSINFFTGRFLKCSDTKIVSLSGIKIINGKGCFSSRFDFFILSWTRFLIHFISFGPCFRTPGEFCFFLVQLFNLDSSYFSESGRSDRNCTNAKD